VDVLATPTTAPVLDGNPHVGKVLMLERSSWRSYTRLMPVLRKSHYTVMVDGRINNPPIFTSTPLLMFAGGARFRVGAGGEREPRIYNVSLPEWDRVSHYIDGSKRLAIPFGVDPDAVDWQPELFLSPEEISRAEELWQEAAIRVAPGASTGAVGMGNRLLVNVSASEPKRRWPDGKFIAALLTARARAPNMPIVVIGLPSEWESVQDVAAAVDAVAAPTPQLRDAFALVGTADLVFTPDTSISHAASAFRKPSLVLLKREHKPSLQHAGRARVVGRGPDQTTAARTGVGGAGQADYAVRELTGGRFDRLIRHVRILISDEGTWHGRRWLQHSFSPLLDRFRPSTRMIFRPLPRLAGLLERHPRRSPPPAIGRWKQWQGTWSIARAVPSPPPIQPVPLT
jgi:ADP-heptose:LPS heptosyltransferase